EQWCGDRQCRGCSGPGHDCATLALGVWVRWRSLALGQPRWRSLALGEPRIPRRRPLALGEPWSLVSSPTSELPGRSLVRPAHFLEHFNGEETCANPF